ncbi:AAA-domain-containing protein [Agrocybe pediades]|nr:AAA-domain-containing protein [Agrocybe pediades]
MRSQTFLRKSQQVLKHSVTALATAQPSAQSSSRVLRNKRFDSVINGISSRRYSSSSAAPTTEAEDGIASDMFRELLKQNDVISEASPGPEEEPDKGPKPRRTRLSAAKEGEVLEFPEGLEDNISYVATVSIQGAHAGFPPPEIFEEALDNLMIALHPQNQQRALHAPSGSSRPVEPTLGLYCPIEGGDYVIDLTVQELAYQTGAEVLVLDSAQLAAGELGVFGKAASSLNLPINPLHFSAPSIPHTSERSGKSMERERREFEDEEEGMPFMFTPARMAVTLPKTLSSTSSRSLLSPGTRKIVSPSKLDTFFETVVNMPISSSEDKTEEVGPKGTKTRPRIIYVRDFPTLAPSSSTWYPSLLAAVRQRRKRILSRSSNVTSSPIVIVFGMTPSIVSPSNSSNSGSSQNTFMNLLINRNSSASSLPFNSRHEHTHDWSESEAAEIAREKRLRSRLRRWEKNALSLNEEFPALASPQESENSSKPSLIVIGSGDAQISMPSSLSFEPSDSAKESSSQFFRSTILVPRSRSINDERESRIARRRELNELIMRMGVGAVGGRIEPSVASSAFLGSEPTSEITEDGSRISTPPHAVWDDWANKVEAWSTVRKIADRAIGSVMAAEQVFSNQDKPSLGPTIVPWKAIEKAWKSYHAMSDTRKNWMKETITNLALPEESTDAQDKLLNAGSEADTVVESIKNDPDLDQHESRLLPCIVDSQSITTTFKQVHLPSHTIDSIRTIVSLPLLHPHAFQHGILKEHSMTGCLLFGPPGTGKTLAVRALAKEAGCRMLAISPSDVMDMYVGEGEKLVRSVFSLARKLSPCVVFLDEIDALFGARMSARESGSAFAHRGVITEFMQEMDGLKSSKEDNVIVIGATNRPFDLDDAVLRRLPRRLMVDLPGEKERKEILKILLRDEQLHPDVSLDTLAKQTESFSGSDLKHLCVSAALDSVKENMDVPWISKHNPDESIQPSEYPMPMPAESSETNTSEVPTAGTLAQSDVVEGSKDGKVKTTFHPRVLQLRNFTQALKEITPSSSESLGSLTELRKWNEEFGEGRKDKKKRQVWGKGLFGFIEAPRDTITPDLKTVTKE